MRVSVGVGCVCAAGWRALRTTRLHEYEMIAALALAIDARDGYTAGHSARVTTYALRLAKHLGVARRDYEILRRACTLHDIGKIGVPDNVLLKPGALDVQERASMARHVTIGVQMLAGVGSLQGALPAIRGHHERWDGRGYPDGLRGTAIPLLARILAVADSFDAMTTPRPYRAALPMAEAARRLRADAGRQFDADVVNAFSAHEAAFAELLAPDALTCVRAS